MADRYRPLVLTPAPVRDPDPEITVITGRGLPPVVERIRCCYCMRSTPVRTEHACEQRPRPCGLAVEQAVDRAAG
ncbi:hypothetical protein [Streptomyces sp. NPDC049881]|uniref:hypothetical protein n=1 Tax=unclassified Streptomyces TaxID=2593676 RepID=UPI00341A1C48